jgi:hypothetical protein
MPWPKLQNRSGSQLDGECPDDLLAVFGPPLPKHVLPNPFADVPM